MGDLSERDVEDVLGGVQPPGRDDLAPVVELTTWLHVSREIEPPPAMRDDLFCQIEAGPLVYQRSSRRTPAHLRRGRTGTRRIVREALAGAGRPIASVAAAAVLLVGVILAVRAGGPEREPSAFVSPSADGLPSTGADEPATTTTTPTTTTTASETVAPSNAGATVSDAGQPTAGKGTTESPAPADARTSGPEARDRDGSTPPTTENRRGGSDDGATDESDQYSSEGRVQPPETAEPTDDTIPWDTPPSGWDFDLSEWSLAEDLWAALKAEEIREPDAPTRDDAPTADDAPTGDAVPSGDDARTDDEVSNDDRDDVGESEHGFVGDVGESEHGFVGDRASERRAGADAERGGGGSD
jgi:hypothetical protein